MFSAEFTDDSAESEWFGLGVLKKVPRTVPGAEMKLKTALKRFRGVGSSMALSRIVESRLNSVFQLLVTISFQLEAEEAGIFLALTMVLLRKGRSFSKAGTVVKVGAMSFSAGGAAMKEATGSRGWFEWELGAGGDEATLAEG